MFIHLILLELSCFYCYRQIGDAYRCDATALLLILPFSPVYIQYVLGGMYYIPHFIVTFTAFGLFLNQQRCRTRNGRRLIFLLQSALAFFAGLGGIRHLQITYIPVFAAVCLMPAGNESERTDGLKRIVNAAAPVIYAAAGYLVNSSILSANYHFASYNNLFLQMLSLSRLEKILNDILLNFGYQGGVELFSVKGLAGVLALLLFTIINFVSLLKGTKALAYGEALAVGFVACSRVLNTGILLFTNNACEARYFLPQMAALIPCFMIMLKRGKNIYPSGTPQLNASHGRALRVNVWGGMPSSCYFG